MSVCEMLHYSKSQFALLFVNTPYVLRQVDSSIGHKLFTPTGIYDFGVTGGIGPHLACLLLLICVCLCGAVRVGPACLCARGCCAADGINR